MQLPWVAHRHSEAMLLSASYPVSWKEDGCAIQDMVQQQTLKKWEIFESGMCMYKQGITDMTGCFNSNLYCTPVDRKAAQVACPIVHW
jgi:hypothetical protein